MNQTAIERISRPLRDIMSPKLFVVTSPMMKAAEFASIHEQAQTVGLAERHVSRQLRLAYLSPDVLRRLTCGR